MDRPYKYIQTLTLLDIGPFNPVLANQPYRTSMILAYIELDLKSKVVSINGVTLEIPSDLNPISH